VGAGARAVLGANNFARAVAFDVNGTRIEHGTCATSINY
jgi:hypothetical protein